ncbi:hypothetical protein BDZ97DRAFT_599133 [Flammula alnicola]|nr:hypothetical protein BDZ97DRAFT_599133 [Flammula alnicola]
MTCGHWRGCIQALWINGVQRHGTLICTLLARYCHATATLFPTPILGVVQWSNSESHRRSGFFWIINFLAKFDIQARLITCVQSNGNVRMIFLWAEHTWEVRRKVFNAGVTSSYCHPPIVLVVVATDQGIRHPKRSLEASIPHLRSIIRQHH